MVGNLVDIVHNNLSLVKTFMELESVFYTHLKFVYIFNNIDKSMYNRIKNK